MLGDSVGDTREMVYAASAAFTAAAGAIHDVRSRRIPNRLTGASLLCGLSLHLILDGFAGLGRSATAGIVAGGLLLVFYLAGGMGAGDVKLMAAVGCLAGLLSLERILIVTVVTGAMLALAIAVRQGRLQQTLVNTWALFGHHRQRGLTAHAELNVSNTQALRMPFAVPIAAGCVASLGLQLLDLQQAGFQPLGLQLLGLQLLGLEPLGLQLLGLHLGKG